MTAYERLCLARAKGRPTTSAFIANIIEDFCELHGDRLYGDDHAVIGGVGRLGGMPVTVIGLEKGSNTRERYRKALRLMRQAEKFSRPVICFVDTSGAYSGIGAEERGQASAIAHNLVEMMSLKTPIISILIGEGGSGGALALAVADEVWMLENAVYSVISPEGASSIIWKDAEHAKEAANSLKITAEDLLSLEIIERIIPEPADNTDFSSVYSTLRYALFDTLHKKCAMPLDELLHTRYEKFRKVGRLDV